MTTRENIETEMTEIGRLGRLCENCNRRILASQIAMRLSEAIFLTVQMGRISLMLGAECAVERYGVDQDHCRVRAIACEHQRSLRDTGYRVVDLEPTVLVRHQTGEPLRLACLIVWAARGCCVDRGASDYKIEGRSLYRDRACSLAKVGSTISTTLAWTRDCRR